jgi:hypothetical protein
MRVSKWVDMGQEVDIDIGVDDISEALSEAFANVNETPFDERPNAATVTRALNHIGGFLRGFKDEHLAMLTEAQRKVVGNFLLEQANRFLGPKQEAQ